jgi:hypothetical protein
MNNLLRIVALGLGLSVVAALTLFAIPRPYPSDNALRARFFAHRADFERLVAMANEDSRLTRIAPDFTWLDDNVAWPRKDVGISESRWNEYRRLFRKVGATQGILKGVNPIRIIFPIASAGLVPTGYSKGLVYSQAPLNPVLESLDKEPPDKLWDGPDHNHVLVYAPIEDHWYIYWEQW